MAYDANRPVPWARLVRDWVIYAGIMAVIFVVLFRDDLSPGTFIGLAVSLPIYLVIGAVLAKFGYSRKSMREVRDASLAKEAAKREAQQATSPSSPQRVRPAATKRTSTGPSQRRPADKNKRKR